MLDKPSASLTIALEAQSTGLRYAALRKNQKNPLISDDVKQLYKPGEDPLFITLLPTSKILLRTLDVPLKKPRDIDETLSFQAEPLIPYPVEEAVLERIILEQKEEGSSLCLAIARKESLKEHLALFADVNPEIVTTIPLALAAFSRAYFPQKEPFVILHLSHLETTFVTIQNNLAVGAQVSSSLLSEPKNQALLDVKRVLFSISKQIKPTLLLLTGEGSADEALVHLLTSSLGIKTEIHPYSRDAASLGSALDSPLSINFRQKEFAYGNPFKRFIKPIALYLGLCAALTAALFIYSKASFSYEENLARQRYVSLLADRGIPYSEFERQLDNEPPLPFEQLSLSAINERLDLLESKYQASPHLFPLQPDTPFVSDLLAWLSAHPVVTKGEGFTLESLHYSMWKRPDLTKKTEKYQVKVELEFNSPTPMQAREFHDSLVAPNDFIDPKSEIKWSSNRGRYKTSFFLKDYTKYKAL